MPQTDPAVATRRWPAGARAGATLLLLLAALGILAPWLAPSDPAEQLDSFGGRWQPPGTTLYVLRLENGSSLLAEKADLEGELYRLKRQDREELIPAARVALGPRPRTFWLGTDHLGRDVYSRWLHATRVSLAVGGFALLIACSLGIAVGALAALGPRWLDRLLMYGVDAFLALPWIFLMICVGAFAPASATALVVLLGTTTWMGVSRLARAQIQTVAEREFVLAARGLGVPPLRVFLRHILPNIATPLLVDATLRAGQYILAEAALSFLGLGIQPPLASWGNMIQDGRGYLLSGWWLTLAPTLALLATGLSVQWLADSLRDLLDPRA
jgi:peptide/nickel transport system permease protein